MNDHEDAPTGDSLVDVYHMWLNRPHFNKVPEEVLNVGIKKCVECRVSMDLYESMYERFDCGGNGAIIGSICKASTYCERHPFVLFCDCPIDQGCLHCEVCNLTEIVRVTNAILKKSPKSYVDSSQDDFRWTEFDYCELCRMPVCYVHRGYTPDIVGSAFIIESSLTRLHTRVNSIF